MRSDRMAISAVYDALGLSAAILDVTTAGVESSIQTMSLITSRLVAAQEDGVDKSKINADLEQFRNQLQSNLNSASSSGQNWLSWNSGKDSLDKQIVSSFYSRPVWRRANWRHGVSDQHSPATDGHKRPVLCRQRR
jgi:flagellin